MSYIFQPKYRVWVNSFDFNRVMAELSIKYHKIIHYIFSFFLNCYFLNIKASQGNLISILMSRVYLRIQSDILVHLPQYFFNRHDFNLNFYFNFYRSYFFQSINSIICWKYFLYGNFKVRFKANMILVKVLCSCYNCVIARDFLMWLQ